jgi:hypothetical protein
MKGKCHYELILFYDKGLTPKDIIAFGYSKDTAYRYFRYYKAAKEIVRNAFIKAGHP